MYISDPVFGRVTQGTIFNCAIAERYLTGRVCGVVITARCDLAQDKSAVVNYLPIVPLSDWLHLDGSEIIFERAQKDTREQITRFLRSNQIAESVLLSQSLSQIRNSFFPDSDTSKHAKGQRDKLDELDQRLDALNLKGVTDRSWLFSTFDGMVKTLVREVALNKLSGQYFLPKVEKDEQPRGYVALMREVRSLPAELAAAIANGLAVNDKLLTKHPTWKQYVRFTVDNFAMPISEVSSPSIEHLLQSFSSLFTRIGLADLDREYVDGLYDKVREVKDPTP